MQGGRGKTGWQLAVAIGAVVLSPCVLGAAPAPAGLAPRSPQIMLYFSHNLGGGVAHAFGMPTFGLRLQQVRQAGNSGDPEASNDPMSHRELLDWQLQGRHDLRVSLGHRLTYDISNRTFGKPNEQQHAVVLNSTRLRAAPMRSIAPDNFTRSDARTAAFPGSAFREPAEREPTALRGLAGVAMSALSPSRLAMQLRWPVPHPNTGSSHPGPMQLHSGD